LNAAYCALRVACSEEPFGANATAYGFNAASFAVAHNLDGVDFDLENLAPNCESGGMTGDQVVAWMVQATTAARAVLGSSGVISHAPQAPYFGAVGGSGWAGPTGW
jgi:hypothetical protein